MSSNDSVHLIQQARRAQAVLHASRIHVPNPNHPFTPHPLPDPSTSASNHSPHTPNRQHDPGSGSMYPPPRLDLLPAVPGSQAPGITVNRDCLHPNHQNNHHHNHTHHRASYTPTPTPHWTQAGATTQHEMERNDIHSSSPVRSANLINLTGPPKRGQRGPDQKTTQKKAHRTSSTVIPSSNIQHSSQSLPPSQPSPQAQRASSTRLPQPSQPRKEQARKRKSDRRSDDDGMSKSRRQRRGSSSSIECTGGASPETIRATRSTARAGNRQSMYTSSANDDNPHDLGKRKGRAYERVHANLAKDKDTRSKTPTTPPHHKALNKARKADKKTVDSPDPIDLLSSDREESPTPRATKKRGGGKIVLSPVGDNGAMPTTAGKGKKRPKALWGAYLNNSGQSDALSPTNLRKAEPDSKSSSKLPTKSKAAKPEPKAKGKAKESPSFAQTSRKPRAKYETKRESESKVESDIESIDSFPVSEPRGYSSPPPVEAASAFFAEMDEQDRLKEERIHAEERQAMLQDVLGVPKEDDELGMELNNIVNRINREQFEAQEKELRHRDENEFRSLRPAREPKRALSEADDFFKDAPQQAEAARRRRSLEAKSHALAAKVDQIDHRKRELNDDERYCERFKDRQNPCPYCKEPLPKNPSADLVILQNRLASAGRVTSRQTSSLCTMHRAETTIIPLGEREGFKTEIDFEEMDRRLEHGWIAKRLKTVVADPALSKFYRRAEREIRGMGLHAWKDVSHQGRDTVLHHTQPGYYGDLGRAIMIRHFQNLIRWGHLVLTEATAPLPEADFIVTVLVPEAAILLIMEDEGWSREVRNSTKCLQARDAAMDLCQRSGNYGYWKFRGDGEDGRRVLAQLERAQGDKRRRLDDAADERKDAARKRASTTNQRSSSRNDPILVGSSDTETSGNEAADPSEWGSEDESWFLAADKAVVEAERRRRASRASVDATPRAGRTGRNDVIDVSTPTPKARKIKADRAKGKPLSQASSNYDEGWDPSMADVDELML